MNIKNHKKTILILILLIIVFFAYWFFFLSKKDVKDNTGQNSNLKTQNIASGTQYDKDFVSILLGLSSINLDTTVLKSKTYQALTYPEVPFVVSYPTESGRNNPFLPIGSDVTNTPRNQRNLEQNTQNQTPATVATPPQTPSAASTTKPTPTLKKF